MEVAVGVDAVLDAAGHLHTLAPALLPEGKCDFCGLAPVRLPWLLRAGPFRITVGIHDQHETIDYANDWLACWTCTGMCKREDARGLAQRAAKHQFKATAKNRRALTDILTVAYRSLFTVTEWAGPNPAATT